MIFMLIFFHYRHQKPLPEVNKVNQWSVSLFIIEINSGINPKTYIYGDSLLRATLCGFLFFPYDGKQSLNYQRKDSLRCWLLMKQHHNKGYPIKNYNNFFFHYVWIQFNSTLSTRFYKNEWPKSDPKFCSSLTIQMTTSNLLFAQIISK